MSTKAFPDMVDDFWSVYQIMRCNFHCHTKDSRTPLINAKNIGDADHAGAQSVRKTAQGARKSGVHPGISDHDSKTTLIEWNDKKQVIDEFCANGFPMFRGFEWTGHNHINIFNSEAFVTVFDVGAEGIQQCKDYDSLYNWLTKQPDDVTAQFNHPSMNKHYFDFAKIAKHPAKDHFRLMEVGSGPTGFYSHVSDNLPQCILAWQLGLHFGVAIGGDNFGPFSEDMAKRHTVLWVKDYSRQGMIEAIRSCRTYASEDRDYSLKFYLKKINENGSIGLTPMGGQAELRDNDIFGLGYDLSDPTDSQIGRVNLIVVKRNSTQTITVSNNGKMIHTVTMNDFTIDELKDIICFFLHIQQPDGDNIVSSPIWINWQSEYYNYTSSKSHEVGGLDSLTLELKETNQLLREIADKVDEGSKCISYGAYSKFDEKLFYPLSKSRSHFDQSIHQKIYVFFDLKIPQNILPQLEICCLGKEERVNISNYLSSRNLQIKNLNKYKRLFLCFNSRDLPAGIYSVRIGLVDTNGNKTAQQINLPKLVFYLH